MKYRFLEKIATADVAFEAYGKTLEELFVNAAKAVMAVMVKPKNIKPVKNYELRIENKEIEELLFDFLSELVFLKDKDQMLFSQFQVQIKKLDARGPASPARLAAKRAGGYTLEANLKGEKIDPQRHQLRSDVKAVTWHLFSLTKEKDGYKARVVVDI